MRPGATRWRARGLAGGSGASLVPVVVNVYLSSWHNAYPAPTYMTMIAFAELLERLVFTPSRNAKIALLRRYFATQPDPDRGIGLAAIAGELSFTAAKPGLIRELASARTDRCWSGWPSVIS